jgi:Lrp/AsnC family transcriptional regulator for asnA, asnC and gidA
MDDLDRRLIVLIGSNPRIHIREIAKELGLSKQAVHHRMQVLKEIGVIKGSIAGISISYLDAVPVAVSGASRTASVEVTLDRLGESEFTRRAIVAGGNYFYVVGFLRDISELDGYVAFVKRAAEMSEPIVGIYCLDDGLMPAYTVDGGGTCKKNFKELSPLDLKIIASLKNNARRPVAEIADTIGVSAKTVRRHLDGMISDGSLDMSMPYDGLSGGEMFFIMHVNLRNGADKRVVGRRLLSKRYFQDQYIRTHGNIPNFLAWVFWSDKISEVRRALKETTEDEEVQSTMLNFAYLERLYTTWRDRLPEAASRPVKRASAGRPPGVRGR